MDNIWSRNGGLYLGWPCDHAQGAPPSLEGPPRQIISPRHWVVIGPNGSGKSMRVLVPLLLTTPAYSCIVIDFKGELAQATAEHRANLGSDVFIINPFNVGGIKSDGGNPLIDIDVSSKEFVDDCQLLAEVLSPIGDTREPHWPESAQDLIAAATMFECITAKDVPTIANVREILGQPSGAFKDEIRDMMNLARERRIRQLYTKAARFSDMEPDDRELHGIISHAMTRTRFMDSEPIREDLGKKGPSFAQLRHKPTTVYLTMAANRIGTHTIWLKMMLTTILNQLQKDSSESKVPILLLCDEASRLSVPLLESSMAMLRGFGIKLISIYQDAPQANLSLKNGLFSSYLANAGVLISFAPQDMDTATLLSRRAGEATVNVASLSTSADQLGRADRKTSNITFNSQRIPAILPHDLMNMDDGYAVVFTHQDKEPRITYFPFPTEIPQFKQILS